MSVRWLRRPPLHLKVEPLDGARPILSLWVGYLSDPPPESAYAALDEICRLVWVRNVGTASIQTLEDASAWFAAQDLETTVSGAIEEFTARRKRVEAAVSILTREIATLRAAVATLSTSTERPPP